MCGTHYQYWKRNGTTEKPSRYQNCAVEDCDRPTKRTLTGLCEAHYYQKRRHGEITSVEIKPYRTPGCKEPGCDQPHDSLGWCQMHYTRYQRHGDPNYVGAPEPKPGPLNPNWQGDDVGYGAVHDRLRSWRGSAGGYQCQHCGQSAEEWAYDYSDPDERTDRDGLAYSTDPGRYIPLCRPCHRRFDRATRRDRGWNEAPPKETCKRGHLLSGDNIRLERGGKTRRCLTCARQTSRESDQRRRQDPEYRARDNERQRQKRARRNQRHAEADSC